MNSLISHDACIIAYHADAIAFVGDVHQKNLLRLMDWLNDFVSNVAVFSMLISLTEQIAHAVSDLIDMQLVVGEIMPFPGP